MTEKNQHISIDGVTHEAFELEEALVAIKIKDALASGKPSYSACETFGFAVKLSFKEVKRRLAEMRSELARGGAGVHALSPTSFLIETAEVFATLSFSQKPKYCSLRFKAWTSSPEAFAAFEKRAKDLFSDGMVTGIMFGLRWAFVGSRGIEDVYVEEIFEDDLVDEAYPALADRGGLDAFVKSYLDSEETVLILQGPPGTGKTRLVRKILAEMSRRAREAGDEDDGSKATAIYTGDQKAFESDEIFANFITGEESALVVEDADHILRARSDGNENVHRFLAVADGVVRASGRKVIFSTNLPNLREVDEALARPGRCFALMSLGHLGLDNAKALAARLGKPEVHAKLEAMIPSELNVAAVYALCGKAKAG